jgi:hypothetical protein
VAYVGAAALLLLILQYFLGLWTNVYAPAQFSNFNSSANYSPALYAHIDNGFVLFFLGIVAVILAALSRRVRTIVPAVVLVASIYGAGYFGMAYVNATPNTPIDSFGMGALFLVALFSAGALLMGSMRARTAPSAPVVTVTT